MRCFPWHLILKSRIITINISFGYYLNIKLEYIHVIPTATLWLVGLFDPQSLIGWPFWSPIIDWLAFMIPNHWLVGLYDPQSLIGWPLWSPIIDWLAFMIPNHWLVGLYDPQSLIGWPLQSPIIDWLAFTIPNHWLVGLYDPQSLIGRTGNKLAPIIALNVTWTVIGCCVCKVIADWCCELYARNTSLRYFVSDSLHKMMHSLSSLAEPEEYSQA